MSDIVWSSKLDGKYEIEVRRTGDYTATLHILEGEKELHQEPVGLSYGAMFGPDVADVADWQEIAIKFIDGKA